MTIKTINETEYDGNYGELIQEKATELLESLRGILNELILKEMETELIVLIGAKVLTNVVANYFLNVASAETLHDNFETFHQELEIWLIKYRKIQEMH